MNKGFIIGLFTGAAVGGVVGYFVTDRLVDKKYQEAANADIEKMRDYYTEKLRAIESKAAAEEEPKVIVKEDAAKMSYNKPPLSELVRDYVVKDKSEESEDVEQAYFITSEDFGEMPDYEQIQLTYDGHVLREFDGEEIIDIEAPNFSEILETIDNYISEDGIVYARCDETRCDYEISIDDSPAEE